MLDINSLECMSLDVLLPDTGRIATVVGRITRELIDDGSVPKSYKIHVVHHKEGVSYVPAFLTEYRHCNDCDPDKIDSFFGYFLTRSPINEVSLKIINWSFFIA